MRGWSGNSALLTTRIRKLLIVASYLRVRAFDSSLPPPPPRQRGQPAEAVWTEQINYCNYIILRKQPPLSVHATIRQTEPPTHQITSPEEVPGNNK